MPPRTLHRWASPAAAGVLLTAMLFVGGISLTHPVGLDAYQARVRAAVDDIPYRIAGWNGENVPPTPGAQRLLRPNVILQRRFEGEDPSRSIALLIVHCGDVRDMDGHYPPLCYPGQGWSLENVTDRDIVIPGQVIPARDYAFSRARNTTVEHILVTDFFVLPKKDQPVQRRIEALEAASRSPSAAGLGSAQVQFVSSGTFEAQELEQLLQSFAAELSPVIRAIGEGVDVP